jgi:hypothetical protein
MIDIDALEALAKSALSRGEEDCESLDDWLSADEFMSSMLLHPIDARFAEAMTPSAIVALIAEVRALREIQAANVEIKMALNVEAQRYRWFRDWFLRGGLRMEIDPVGHIRVTTPDIVDAAIDAARGAK